MSNADYYCQVPCTFTAFFWFCSKGLQIGAGGTHSIKFSRIATLPTWNESAFLFLAVQLAYFRACKQFDLPLSPKGNICDARQQPSKVKRLQVQHHF
jgi:hypothetical protein